jgi:hypothetical protein
VTRGDVEQLTFTSFDTPGGGGGGWQVKQESPGLRPDERALALQHVAAELNPVVPVPRFPSDREIEQFPRAFVLHIAEGDELSAVFVHSAMAGPDGSGRPGNVFNHVIIDRGLQGRLAGPEPVRPVQLWRSPDWLTPYGPEQVREASFGDEAPRPGPVERQAVAAFLAASATPRLNGLGALLDAAAAVCLEDAPDVVVIADDVDEGVLWLASVMFFASPTWSGRDVLTFSTFERAGDLNYRGTRARFSVVLRSDLGNATLPPDLVRCVLDPSRQAPADDAGWPTVDGRRVRRTSWSILASAVAAQGQPLIEDRLLALDELSGLNPDAADGWPWWALAMAVGELEELSSAWPVAAQVVLTQTVAGAQLDDETRRLRGRLVQALAGTSPAALWDLLEPMAAAGGDPDLLADVYEQYLAQVSDREALCAPDPPRALEHLAEPLRNYVLSRAAMPLIAQIPLLHAHVSADWALWALRFLDLCFRVGLQVQEDSGQELQEVLRRVAAVVNVRDEFAQSLVDRVGPLHPGTAAIVAAELGELLDSIARSSPQEALLDPEIARWLAEPLGNGVGRVASGPLLTELLLGRAAADPDWADANRSQLAIVLLDAPGGSDGTDPQTRAVRALQRAHGSAARPWECRELLDVVTAIADRQDVDLVPQVVRALLETKPDAVTTALAARTEWLVAQRGGGMEPADASVLGLYRLIQPRWYLLGSPDTVLDVVRCGLSCWSERDRVGDESREDIAPHLLLALLRYSVWTGLARNAVDDHELVAFVRARDIDVREVLELGLEPARALFTELAAASPDAAVELLEVVLRLRAGIDDGTAVLSSVLLTGPAPGGGRSGSVAELLLRDHLDSAAVNRYGRSPANRLRSHYKNLQSRLPVSLDGPWFECLIASETVPQVKTRS